MLLLVKLVNKYFRCESLINKKRLFFPHAWVFVLNGKEDEAESSGSVVSEFDERKTYIQTKYV